MPYICPICQSPLIQHLPSKGYYCQNKHHFDMAKEGYLNLLPVQHKKSKEPGDNRTMMRSRRNFLEAGFYLPLARAVAALIEKQQAFNTPLHILDMGCGEGYYCRQIEAFSQNPAALDLHGIDIAKNAILAAAKKQPNAHFTVASNKRMPYRDQFFDLIVKVCAPSNNAEIRRLLKSGGRLLTVTPGPRHLWQLKELIYKTAKEHRIDPALPDDFVPIDRQRLRFTINPNQEQRMTLLQMTPFAWRAKGEIRSEIQRAKDLVIETDFMVTLTTKP